MVGMLSVDDAPGKEMLDSMDAAQLVASEIHAQARTMSTRSVTRSRAAASLCARMSALFKEFASTSLLTEIMSFLGLVALSRSSDPHPQPPLSSLCLYLSFLVFVSVFYPLSPSLLLILLPLARTHIHTN